MRRVDPRYVTSVEFSTLEFSGVVSAHYGPRRFVVLNLSEGGAALSFADGGEIPKEFKPGSQLDVSFEIQKKVFPATISLRGVAGARLHCQFVAKTPAFESALKEFFVPKTLGVALSRNESLSEHPEVQVLVPEAEWHEVWVAPNQTGLFMWFGEDDAVLKMLLVSKDLAWSWTKGEGARSGHRSLNPVAEGPHQAFEIIWDRELSSSTKVFVNEVLASWLGMSDEARRWVARLVEADKDVDVLAQIGASPLLRRIRKA